MKCTYSCMCITCIHVYTWKIWEIVKEETALRKEKEAVCCYVHVDVHV